jgi:hypothetical protein
MIEEKTETKRKNEDFYYLLFTGETADTLKEVRQKIGCSGRALPYYFKDGRVKRVYTNKNVQHEKEYDRKRK